ncbi:MAG: hypothetical protein JW814_03580 [Candidatus Krumholzibacteriota bacterium]|nr:hypothetical protein [Candidatus Krumholzibacteriota bacterium]
MPLTFKSLFLVAAFLISFSSSPRGAADRRNDQALSDSTLYKVVANSMQLREVDGAEVTYLRGDVRIDHQSAWITGENGEHYRERKYTNLRGNIHGQDGTMDMYGDLGEYFGFDNLLILIDNVHITDEGMDIVCDRASYDRKNGWVILIGRVRLSDETRVMYADSIFYDRGVEIADATGHVVIIDQIEEYSISGNHGRFFRESREAVIDSNPVLVFDDRSDEKGRIVGKIMHFDMDQSIGSATGDVQMVKGDTRANCDSAAIFNDLQFVELFGDPVATSGSSGMSGEKVILHYNDRGVERIILPHSGRLTDAPAQGSPWREDSWLEGDSLIIYMSEDAVDSVKIFGNARAMYYPYEGDESKVSNNYSKGDSMYFRFREEDLSYVRISGHAEGLYNYLNLGPRQTIDSLAAAIDTTIQFHHFGKNAERVVYKAKKIEYFAEVEDIVLDADAVLDYQNRSLRAGHIVFNSRLNILEAEDGPVLVENEQEMFGLNMGYDLDSAGGLVKGGSTHYDSGYFRGDHIFKDRDKVLKVYHSIYTTCDLKMPHYSMRANKMKIYIGDKIVSGPIRLYIGEIPVFYLPFMANSLNRDRHSGILRPNFDIGINSRDGRFIRGLGYYWATNDYTDFILTTDFNENSNFRFRLDNRYKIRYLLDGNVNFNYFRNFVSNSNEWTIKGKHSQKFGRTASLNADLSFVSSDKAQSSVFSADDVQRVIDRRIYSTASFRKSWGGTSLSLSARRDQKLNVSDDNPYENRVSMTVPSFSLNLPRTSLWQGDNHPESQRGSWEKILRSISFAPNIKGDIKTDESLARKRGKISASSGMSLSQQHKLSFINFSPSVSVRWNYLDVLYDNINEDLVVDATRALISGDTISVPVNIDALSNQFRFLVDGIEGSLLSVTPRICNTAGDLQVLASDIEAVLFSDGAAIEVGFTDTGGGTGYFTFRSEGYGTSSSLEVADAGVNPIYPLIGILVGDYDAGSNRTGPVTDTSYNNEVSMSFSSRIGTSIYGTFYPKIGRLRGIRHTFNPTVSYSFTPSLTDKQVESQSVSYTVRNILDFKYLRGEEEVKKNNALSWEMRGTYNPKLQDGKKFSTINSNIRTAIGRLASVRLDHTIDPYEWDILSTNISVSMNQSFSGNFSYGSGWKREEKERIAAAIGSDKEGSAGDTGSDDLADEFPEMRDHDGEDPGRDNLNGSGNYPSWNVSLGYSYSTNYGKFLTRTMSSKVNLNGTLNLTKGWTIKYTAYYDPEARRFTSQMYSINRDLHCWEANFVHRRFGYDWGYYFQIRIKELPDIFYESGKRGLRGMSAF